MTILSFVYFFAALAWPMTSLIVSVTMLTWSQTLRFDEILLAQGLFCFLAKAVKIFMFSLLSSYTEHQEAFEDSLQQVARQYGRAQSWEDVAVGRAGHSGAFYELLQGTVSLMTDFLLSVDVIVELQSKKNVWFF